MAGGFGGLNGTSSSYGAYVPPVGTPIVDGWVSPNPINWTGISAAAAAAAPAAPAYTPPASAGGFSGLNGTSSSYGPYVPPVGTPIVDGWVSPNPINWTGIPAAGAAPAHTPPAPVATPASPTPGRNGNTDVATFGSTAVPKDLWASVTTPSEPPSYDPSYYDAVTDTVKKDQTVAGQMEGLLSQDSDLMRVARTNALQQANGRGLLNSSMANGATTKAMIESGLPIAQQDATTYANQQTLNQGLLNDEAKDNNLITNSVNQYNTSNKQADYLADKSSTAAERLATLNNNADLERVRVAAEEEAKLAASNAVIAKEAAMYEADIQKEINKLDSESTFSLEQMKMNYETAYRDNERASSEYKTYLDKVSGIISNKDISASDAAARLDKLSAYTSADIDFMRQLEGGNTSISSSSTDSYGGDYSTSWQENDYPETQLGYLTYAKIQEQPYLSMADASSKAIDDIMDDPAKFDWSLYETEPTYDQKKQIILEALSKQYTPPKENWDAQIQLDSRPIPTSD